jgi:hypothetical protein
MRDFSIEMLRELLTAFKEEDFLILPFERYWPDRDHIDGTEKVVLLRHDVDRLPGTALAVARMEARIGVRGSYFFRVKPWTFKTEIIREIAGLGHEIAYHYENLADAGGDPERAKRILEDCLARLREIYPVVSASMHSRAFSKWDGRTFWDRFMLSDFGLLGECYRSIDHHRYMYLADSGRNWNADRNVIWDSVDGTAPPRIDRGTRGLIGEIRAGGRITRVQLLIHPNRWPDTVAGEAAQYAMDKMINLAKSAIKTFAGRGERS